MPIRILHVLNNLGSGGVEGLLMNIYRVIDRAKIQFDFMIRSARDNRFADEVEQMGGRVFIMPDFPRKVLDNYRAVDAFFAEHKEYDIIHVHANALIYTIPLLLARKHGVPHRILHSHSTGTSGGLVGRVLHKLNKLFLDILCTDRLACSEDAARWMYGKRTYTLVNNGIDIESYRYSPERRQQIRSQLGLRDELLIGHVGRFLPVKNHDFIIEVFAELLKQSPDAKLLLIGEGKMSPKTQKRIRNLNIEDNIIQTGVVSNVHEYMSAMDIFIFPSKYEGLGIAGIEAQASGLPSFISDKIPERVMTSDSVHVLSLKDSPQEWANAILSCRMYERVRVDNNALENFDIRKTAQKLVDFYSEMK